jgi:DNA-directed RNA polymerase specialized sigma24 family protein
MSSLGSVETWLRQFQEGHLSALGRLHQRYWPALVGYARARLRLTPNPAADAEDLVQAAFLSFQRAFREGRAPMLASRDNLLALLTTLIARKAARKVRGPNLTDGLGPSLLEQLAEDPTPSPLERALVNDCYEHYVGGLPEKLRPFAEMALAGLTHREVAAAVPCAVRTVERKMALILQRWQDLADAEA